MHFLSLVLIPFRFYRTMLFVRLSVALMDCIQTAEDIVKLFSRPGSHVILIFDPGRLRTKLL